MKNQMKKFNSALTCRALYVQNIARKTKAALKNESGQFVMDHTFACVIGVAVAAVVLSVVIGFVQNDLAPNVTNKILNFMN